MKDEDKIRERILKKILDLKNKIKKNEPYPHGNQDISSLYDTEELIDNILGGWYY